MNKFTYVTVLLLLVAQFNFSQEIFKRVVIPNSSKTTINTLTEEGIDLRCGAIFADNSIQLELSDYELDLLNNKGIPYTVEIDDLTKFYSERATRDLPFAKAKLEIDKARSALQRSSVSNAQVDNYLQYGSCDEVDWVTPTNFNLNPNPSPNSFGGCLTISQVESELDDMYNYSQTNSLDIISTKASAHSGTMQTNGNTYGATDWDPQTIYYVRITGDQSSTPEGTKPQILYTSMIHSREVGALMGNLYFMWYLLENYATNPAIKNLVDNNELYFVPVVNPDGLRWNEVRNPNGGGMQRKNLGDYNTGNTDFRGADVNRNFDYFWGSAGSGSSDTPSSNLYRGPSAASEPETQIMVDFIEDRNFKTAVWHHTYANGIPHPYGGNPTFVSGREDEMHKWHEDMTKYNRYVSGATIFTPANGIPDDWMVGGSVDTNGSTGASYASLATTPENGHYDESFFNGFWPLPSNIVPIAKRMMRINLMNAYYGGKYAKFHDLTQSDITSLTPTLTFGIERLGQTASDFTLTITPISTNITSVISSPASQSGMTILEQRNVTAQLQLDPGILDNNIIEYNVKLSNDDGVVFYDANIEKFYNPNVLFFDDAESVLTTSWTQSGGWNNTSSDAYSGSNALRTGDDVPYAINNTKTLTTTSTYDLSSTNDVVVQFYTKWDLERNYDFVEILGSADNGSSWFPLCGKYNKPNSTKETNDAHGGKTTTASQEFQSNNSSGQIYDGDQMDKWVMEEIVIDASNNSFLLGATNAQFRFIFRSDADNKPEKYSTTYDGFFIDDFKIISVPLLSERPVANCKDITVQLDATGAITILPSEVDNVSTDDVGIISYSLDVDTFSCADIGDHSVTLTVTDADGQTDTCVAVVSVVDNTGPTITLNGAASIDVEACTGTYTELGATATDNCSVTDP